MIIVLSPFFLFVLPAFIVLILNFGKRSTSKLVLFVAVSFFLGWIGFIGVVLYKHFFEKSGVLH